MNEDSSSSDMRAVGTKGFVDYRMVKNKKYGYKFKYYPVDGRGIQQEGKTAGQQD